MPLQPRLSSNGIVDTLLPIRDIADYLDVPLSTLHFWERRGLISAHRRGGKRYFDEEQFYRIAMIHHWRTVGTLSIEEISAVLAIADTDPTTNATAVPAADLGADPERERFAWRQPVRDRLATIERHQRRLEEAEAYLRHLLTCRRDHTLERCESVRRAHPLPMGPDVIRRQNRESSSVNAAS